MKGVEETRPSAFAPLSIIGKTLHSLMEIYERREVSKNKFGINATIDMLKEDNKPIEIKTTRATVTLETLLTKFKEWKEQFGHRNSLHGRGAWTPIHFKRGLWKTQRVRPVFRGYT